MFGRRICVIETGRKIGRRVDAAGDGRAPGPLLFPTRLSVYFAFFVVQLFDSGVRPRTAAIL